MSHRQRNKKKKLGNKKKAPRRDEWQQDVNPDKSSGVKWKADLVKENALFEKFYAEIVPEGEMPAFLEAMRRELPVVFRTSPTSVFAPYVDHEIASHFPSDGPIQVGDAMVDPPCQLNWFPGVWMFKASRKQTRSEPKLKHFKEWLVGAAEAGQVVRQEAVSMIPPVLLEVEPHHVVFDACASPGSKTTQLLESLHRDGHIASGVVVANELNESRARMLAHRLKSITSANLLITNHDARMFPRLHVGKDFAEPLDFDRILCDVPCSGDGTMRKAQDMWTRWSPDMARGIHSMQLRIAERSLRMLKVGGRIVYSTCSMSPLEDEAVVAEMLRKSEGAMQLVDCSHQFPEFQRLLGRSTWKVMNKAGAWVEPSDDEAKLFPASVWPPTQEEAEKFHLDRCWRILPHHNDTGGFFVAVLEKVAPLPGAPKRAKIAEPEEEKGKEEEAEAAPEEGGDKPAAAPKKKERVRRSYESPFIMVEPDSEFGASVREGLEYFGLDLDPKRFMVRNEKSVKIFFYVGGFGPEILPMDSKGRLHVCSAGTRVFVKHKRTGSGFHFRLASEACELLAHRMTKRVIDLSLDDAIKLASADSVVYDELSRELVDAVKGMDPGSIAFRVQGLKAMLPVLGWIAPASLQLQIPKENRAFVTNIIKNARGE